MVLNVLGVSLLAVLAAVVAHMILGMVWYGAFSTPWMARAYPGKTKDDLQAGSKLVYLVPVIAGLVTAFVLGFFFARTDVTTVTTALGWALFAWVGFTGSTFAMTYAFAGKDSTLWAIDTGYHLVSFLAMSALLVLVP